jgi:hypothetical protein
MRRCRHGASHCTFSIHIAAGTRSALSARVACFQGDFACCTNTSEFFGRVECSVWLRGGTRQNLVHRRAKERARKTSSQRLTLTMSGRSATAENQKKKKIAKGDWMKERLF